MKTSCIAQWVHMFLMNIKDFRPLTIDSLSFDLIFDYGIIPYMFKYKALQAMGEANGETRDVNIWLRVGHNVLPTSSISSCYVGGKAGPNLNLTN